MKCPEKEYLHSESRFSTDLLPIDLHVSAFGLRRVRFDSLPQTGEASLETLPLLLRGKFRRAARARH